jgi:hypothetical protein
LQVQFEKINKTMRKHIWVPMMMSVVRSIRQKVYVFINLLIKYKNLLSDGKIRKHLSVLRNYYLVICELLFSTMFYSIFGLIFFLKILLVSSVVELEFQLFHLFNWNCLHFFLLCMIGNNMYSTYIVHYTTSKSWHAICFRNIFFA